MSERNDGGPAFPCETNPGFWYGMSLRDWFAGQIATGMLANHSNVRLRAEQVAEAAYKIADAMLDRREQS